MVYILRIENALNNGFTVCIMENIFNFSNGGGGQNVHMSTCLYLIYRTEDPLTIEN